MKDQMYNFSSWLNLTDKHSLKKHFFNLLSDSGFTILDTVEKDFMPQGFTWLVLLSESHFAIHTFPEHNSSYIELSSCVGTPFNKFVTNLNKYIGID